MKKLIEYLIESKQNFLIKGHTKTQHYPEIERIYNKIDKQITNIFGELNFEFDGQLKDRNVMYSYTSRKAKIPSCTDKKIKKFIDSIRCPEIEISNIKGQLRNFYEIVYDFKDTINKRWIYKLDITDSTITKNIVEKI